MYDKFLKFKTYSLFLKHEWVEHFLFFTCLVSFGMITFNDEQDMTIMYHSQRCLHLCCSQVILMICHDALHLNYKICK